jgi:hypothetical protein
MTTREDLHRLVDELDEERVEDARELLRRLRPRQGEPAGDSGTGLESRRGTTPLPPFCTSWSTGTLTYTELTAADLQRMEHLVGQYTDLPPALRTWPDLVVK